MATKVKVGVLGASGYTGSECVRLLLRHPHVEIVLLTADRRAGQAMRDVFTQFSPLELPQVITQLLAETAKTKVVDLSADFRLADPAAYARWYGHDHHATELQKEAVYG